MHGAVPGPSANRRNLCNFAGILKSFSHLHVQSQVKATAVPATCRELAGQLQGNLWNAFIPFAPCDVGKAMQAFRTLNRQVQEPSATRLPRRRINPILSRPHPPLAAARILFQGLLKLHRPGPQGGEALENRSSIACANVIIILVTRLNHN